MYCQTKSILIFQIIGFLLLSVLAGLFAVFPMVFGIMGATMMTDQKLMVTRQPSINITKQYRTRLPFLFFLPRRGGGRWRGARRIGPLWTWPVLLPGPWSVDLSPSPPPPDYGLLTSSHPRPWTVWPLSPPGTTHDVGKKKDFQLPFKIMFSMASVITTKRITYVLLFQMPICQLVLATVEIIVATWSIGVSSQALCCPNSAVHINHCKII